MVYIFYFRDRKRKKFVGESGQDSTKNKRIKTESGHWIRASYKSSAYKDWKDRHKIDTPLGRGEEERVVAGGVAPRAGPRRGFKHKKGARDVEKGPVADLKPRATILKKRQKKALLEQRKRARKANTKAGKGAKTAGKNQKTSKFANRKFK